MVDSIVRQSRHQFGVDKDVFGPRFLKNFTETFQNLYRCPDDDKVICIFGDLCKYNKCHQKKSHRCDFFPLIRPRLSVSLTCGRRTVCLTWTFFSRSWIWQMESLLLVLQRKVVAPVFTLHSVCDWVLAESKVFNDVMHHADTSHFIVSEQFFLSHNQRRGLLSVMPQSYLQCPSYRVLML